MSHTATPTATQREAAVVDNIILLRHVRWADYQRLLEIRGERPAPRLTYLEGAIELMTPSQPHETIKSMIGCLVEAWCFERGVGITPNGSWTLESKETDRGIEPDECYVLGDNPQPVRPDLAIEVEWTRGVIDKLDVYRKLGVQEVWIWRNRRIEVFELRGDHYAPIDGSQLLRGLDLALLLTFIEVRPMTRAVTEFRKALATSS